MIEEIGRVKLDYSSYPGKDLYCDGEVEDELLEIVKSTPQEEYGRVIEERKNWPILYHLSSFRQNIIDWIPMEKNARVLEVGSGCGAITGALAKKAGSVTCVELSKKRSMINAYRNRECGNVTIHVGNFKDIEPKLPGDYDFIFLIGVFEYGQSYIGGETPYHDFLKILTPHLALGGRIVIAIENKYGLKYFAGCREDHLGTYFSGVENYKDGDGVRTFGRNGLEKILRDCGVEKYQFYYPYPDYKFMTTLYSDEYLPDEGELSNNKRNFDRDRMLLFDEKSAYDGLLEDGLFPVFSNSYLLVTGEGFDTKYVKYSNDRAPEYAIRTEISKDAGGMFHVRKYPAGEASLAHVRGMERSYESLREKYRGGRLKINRCRLEDKAGEFYAEFEFVRGTPLSKLMDRCLKRNDLEGFYQYFREYVERIGYNNSYPATDFDLIFSNILVDEDTWTVIDYEWTFQRPADTKELAFRAVYCYILEDKGRESLDMELVKKELHITEAEADLLRKREMDFQKSVTGNRASMAEIWEAIGQPVHSAEAGSNRQEGTAGRNQVQIYEDSGRGFNEEQSFFLKEGAQLRRVGGALLELAMLLPQDRVAVRIDPCSYSCVIHIKNIRWNGTGIPIEGKRIQVNGFKIGWNMYAFPTEDPNITVSLLGLESKGDNILEASLEVMNVPEETIRCMQKKELKRICDRMAALTHKVCHWLRNERRTEEPAPKLCALRRYEDELRRQKDPYGQWIRTCENKITSGIEYKSEDGETDYSEECGTMSPIEVQGFQKIEIHGADIVLLTYGCGLISEDACEKIKSYFDKNPSCMAAYADEDFYWEDLKHRMEPWFKPDYSPDTLLAFHYWGHLVAVRRQILAGLFYRSEEMTGSPVDFYALCLRLEEEIWEQCGTDVSRMKEAVCHMEEVLYHQKYLPSERELPETASREERFLKVKECLAKELETGKFTVGAGKEFVPVKEEACRRRGIRADFRRRQDLELYQIVYEPFVSGGEQCRQSEGESGIMSSCHMVSVVIPSKDNPEALEQCLKTFRDKTAYRHYEWIVVDNGSSEKNRLKLNKLQQVYGFTYLYEPMPFNFSRMCNLGVQRARGELVLLMNDDIEIIEEEWLERMVGQALQPHTGAVGAKLWYTGGRQIQHAGVTNMQIGPAHKLITFPDDRDYYYGRNRLVYNMIGVTGACLMVTREKYEEVGGLDESMPIAYNDVDFCFKLVEAGYYNVQRNDVTLYHHESLSRGLDELDAGKKERLLAEKDALYAKHPGMLGRDPFYHKDLIDDASEYVCNYYYEYRDRFHTRSVTEVSKAEFQGMSAKAEKGTLHLTVDRAEIQHKIQMEEPDILWVMGWCYVKKADNALFDKKVLLRRADGGGYLAVPADWHREDVEAVLPNEKNVGLAGFVLRVRREDMKPGEYQVGMLCSAPGDADGDRTAVKWSNSKVKVS